MLGEPRLVSRPSLDETDIKIIGILQEEPRTTYLQLSRDCKVSIDSVRRRYERLRKEGIVVREILALIPKAMGFDSLSWLGIVTDPGKENQVLESLQAKREILLSFVEIGKYNIRSLLGIEHINDLANYVDSLKKTPYINDVDVMIWSDIERMAYPKNLMIEPFHGTLDEVPRIEPDFSEPRTSSTSLANEPIQKDNLPLSKMCPSMDKTDEAILNILIHNARIPFSNIAKQLGISTKTVICRYRKLRKKWVWYSTLAINLRKIGYAGYVSYNIKVSSKTWVSDVFDRLIKIPNIIVALKMIGPYNINALAPFSSAQQLMKTHASISAIPGVERIDEQIGDSMHVWPTR